MRESMEEREREREGGGEQRNGIEREGECVSFLCAGTHGTGFASSNMATLIVSMRVVMGTGEVITVNHNAVLCNMHYHLITSSALF